MTMGPQHFLDTVSREHHLLASSFAALTPNNFRLRVDKGKLLQAFSLHTIEEADETGLSSSTSQPTDSPSVLEDPTSDVSERDNTTVTHMPKHIYHPAPWPEGSNNVVMDVRRLAELEEELYHHGSFTPSVFLETAPIRAFYP